MKAKNKPKKRVTTKVNAIICPVCNDRIFSRARHDFRSCSCNAIFVDGGFDYMRCGGREENLSKIEHITLNVSATKEQLYNDWNKVINKFGLIKSTKETR